MKVVSLFAGIGGFDLALTRLGHKIVWSNEYDKYAVETYNKNFQNHWVDPRDIRTVPTSDIPDHDLLVAGFPCQAFSIAGKRRGFSDTRGTLFFEIARILKDKRPPFILLENVKGLLSHQNGRTFQTILRTLDELGYKLEWQVLNSRYFAVPHNRERIFIIGVRREISFKNIFPIQAVQDSFMSGQQLLEGSGQSRTKDRSVRKLTPLECERLQGFPDGWTEGVSDTQRYKQLGNAVTVNVVSAIAERLVS